MLRRSVQRIVYAAPNRTTRIATVKATFRRQPLRPEKRLDAGVLLRGIGSFLCSGAEVDCRLRSIFATQLNDRIDASDWPVWRVLKGRSGSTAVLRCQQL